MEACDRSHDNGCQAFATYEVTTPKGVRPTCGTHLTRVVQDAASGNDGIVTVKVLRKAY